MVYQYCYIMTLMYVFAHSPILRRKRRGIQPEGIQTFLDSNRMEISLRPENKERIFF